MKVVEDFELMKKKAFIILLHSISTAKVPLTFADVFKDKWKGRKLPFPSNSM